MSKLLALLSALVAAGILVVMAVLLFANPDRSALNAFFGQSRAASEIFLPVKPRAEERIVRHLLPDGTAADDVLMRDGTTKRMVYDRNMVLRQVFAYYKGESKDLQGPLMYEKTHDAQGHLASERHLRADGSLEMDGIFKADNTYVRHLYFPGPSQDPRTLVVSTEQIFDKLWHPTLKTDFGPDGTRVSVHIWGAGTDELVATLSADGKTIVSAEGKKNGSYYSVLYYPDGQSIKMDIQNGYSGTTIQWFRQDEAHSLALKATFDNSQNDQIVITNKAGKPLVNQVWSLDYSGQPYSADQPRVLDHIDHYNDSGRVDIRYDFDRISRSVKTVTYYKGDNQEPYGMRFVYTVGTDGLATKVESYDAHNTSDGGKPLTPADAKRFVLEQWMYTRPAFVLPALKEGLKLYGDPQQEEYDRD
jgi:hypothetical protein